MSILTQFNQRLAAASDKLGFDLAAEEQGSYNWHRARLGVITASEVSDVLKSPSSASYTGYMAIKIAEIATGAPVDAKRISVKELEWGRTHEGSARETYQFVTGELVSTFTMLHSDNMRCGFSPDGVIESLSRGAEIKCPWNTRFHIESVVDGAIKKEYMDQVQFSMWVSGLNEWEFVSFDPRMRKNNLFHTTIERSDKHMKLFDDAVPQFCLEMDRKLQLVGFEFGDQWK
ncbi:MAG: lambda exonuclease family protein [Plesiomonas shigelloides]